MKEAFFIILIKHRCLKQDKEMLNVKEMINQVDYLKIKNLIYQLCLRKYKTIARQCGETFSTHITDKRLIQHILRTSAS
jgi:hypothetical protein